MSTIREAYYSLEPEGFSICPVSYFNRFGEYPDVNISGANSEFYDDCKYYKITGLEIDDMLDLGKLMEKLGFCEDMEDCFGWERWDGWDGDFDNWHDQPLVEFDEEYLVNTLLEHGWKLIRQFDLRDAY